MSQGFYRDYRVFLEIFWDNGKYRMETTTIGFI